jgi:hypothetical protein
VDPFVVEPALLRQKALFAEAALFALVAHVRALVLKKMAPNGRFPGKFGRRCLNKINSRRGFYESPFRQQFS